MIQRFDQIAVDLPEPSGPNPAAAAAIQELMGGKFGEMSTLMNYTFQSFNFRGKEKYRPFYDLICNIAAEEYSHIEAVAATINLLLNGAVPRADRNKPFGEDADSKKKKAANRKDFGDANPAPLSDTAITAFYRYHFANSGQAAVPFDGMGNPWNGSYVTATGNLKMDLLHNFFLECGARAGKSRVYEMAPDPTSRAMCGYLLVRGGVHIVAYAKALEKLTGTPVGGLLPIPDVSNKNSRKRWPSRRACTRSCGSGVPRILTRKSAKYGTGHIRRTAWSWKCAMKCLLAFRGRKCPMNRRSARPARSIPRC